MLRPRVIPCLLVKNRGLVKTVNFSNPKYVGDPINAVKIFNEKEVDELIILDIDATAKGLEPDYVMIENLATECRMPFCYGGGVKTIDQAKRIIKLGVEKIALSSAAITQPNLVAKFAEQIGSQSIVVVLDIKKNNKNGEYELYTHNGSQKSVQNFNEFVPILNNMGVGEIVINSIDNDGLMKGYDLDLVGRVRNMTSVPLTILGGAGTLNDIKRLIERYRVIGAAAGSLFVFKGIFRAVLINYPDPLQKEALSESIVLEF